MLKKTLFILILVSALAAFLMFRSIFLNANEAPTLVDRLPTADLIGRCNLLALADETSAMLYNNKVPFRDLCSHEFLLSQAKNFGLDLQKEVYFFGNEKGDWGTLIEVNDSSKVRTGVLKLAKIFTLTDTLIYDQTVYQYKEKQGYLSYGKDWIFIYQGKDFSSNFKRIYFAKKDVIESCWIQLLKSDHFRNEHLVLYSNSSLLKDQGIDELFVAHDSDSLQFKVHSYIKTTDSLKVTAKANGVGFVPNASSKIITDLHVNIAGLRKDKNHPLYKSLVRMGRKISFPTAAFMDAWEGDLSFIQGGFVHVKETYIESVMDEEFNVTEVEKVKTLKVPGYYIMISVNDNYQYLLSRLLQKGILTKEEEKYRFITSPQLTMQKKDQQLYFYSGEFMPNLEVQKQNKMQLTHKGTAFQFFIDSLAVNEIFGSVHIPVNRLLKQNKFMKF